MIIYTQELAPPLFLIEHYLISGLLDSTSDLGNHTLLLQHSLPRTFHLPFPNYLAHVQKLNLVYILKVEVLKWKSLSWLRHRPCIPRQRDMPRDHFHLKSLQMQHWVQFRFDDEMTILESYLSLIYQYPILTRRFNPLYLQWMLLQDYSLTLLPFVIRYSEKKAS